MSIYRKVKKKYFVYKIIDRKIVIEVRYYTSYAINTRETFGRRKVANSPRIEDTVNK